MAISNLKFPGSVTPEMKIVTIGFNLIKHFEETGFPLGFLTEEKDTLPVDLTELKKNLKLLFEKVPGILYEPALSVNIFLSHLAANISYYKKRKLKVPDNVAEKAFMIILKI